MGRSLPDNGAPGFSPLNVKGVRKLRISIAIPRRTRNHRDHARVPSLLSGIDLQKLRSRERLGAVADFFSNSLHLLGRDG